MFKASMFTHCWFSITLELATSYLWKTVVKKPQKLLLVLLLKIQVQLLTITLLRSHFLSWFSPLPMNINNKTQVSEPSMFGRFTFRIVWGWFCWYSLHELLVEDANKAILLKPQTISNEKKKTAIRIKWCWYSGHFGGTFENLSDIF